MLGDHGLTGQLDWRILYIIEPVNLSRAQSLTQFTISWLFSSITEGPENPLLAVLTGSGGLWAAQRCLLQFRGYSCAEGHCKDRKAAMREKNLLHWQQKKALLRRRLHPLRIAWDSNFKGKVGQGTYPPNPLPPSSPWRASGLGQCTIQIKSVQVTTFLFTKSSQASSTSAPAMELGELHDTRWYSHTRIPYLKGTGRKHWGLCAFMSCFHCNLCNSNLVTKYFGGSHYSQHQNNTKINSSFYVIYWAQ